MAGLTCRQAVWAALLALAWSSTAALAQTRRPPPPRPRPPRPRPPPPRPRPPRPRPPPPRPRPPRPRPRPPPPRPKPRPPPPRPRPKPRPPPPRPRPKPRPPPPRPKPRPPPPRPKPRPPPPRPKPRPPPPRPRPSPRPPPPAPPPPSPLSCEWDLTRAAGDSGQLSIPVNFDASDDGCPSLIAFNPAYTSPGFCESQGFPDPALVTLDTPQPSGLTLAARDSCHPDGRASRWTVALAGQLPPNTKVSLTSLTVSFTGPNINTGLPISYVFTDPDSGSVLPTPGSTLGPGTFTAGAQLVNVELGAALPLDVDVGVSLALEASPLNENELFNRFQAIAALRSYTPLPISSPICSWDLSAATGSVVLLTAAPAAGSDPDCPSLELVDPTFTEQSNCFGFPTLNQNAGGVALVSSLTCRSSSEKWASNWGVRVAASTPFNVRPRLSAFTVGATGTSVNLSNPVSYSVFGDAGTSASLSTPDVPPPFTLPMGNPLTLSKSPLTFQLSATRLSGFPTDLLFQRILELQSSPE